jgi:hypothetical protein
MEAEPPDAPTLIIIIRQSIEICPGRQAGEEGGVKNGHLRHARQQRFGCFNCFQGRRVVQRGQLGETGNRRLDLGINQNTVSKLRSSVSSCSSSGAINYGAKYNPGSLQYQYGLYSLLLHSAVAAP